MGSYEIDERLYVNTLYFEPATFLNVGYYYCVKKSAVTEEFAAKLDNQWKEVGTLGFAANFTFLVLCSLNMFMFGLFISSKATNHCEILKVCLMKIKRLGCTSSLLVGFPCELTRRIVSGELIWCIECD